MVYRHHLIRDTFFVLAVFVLVVFVLVAPLDHDVFGSMTKKKDIQYHYKKNLDMCQVKNVILCLCWIFICTSCYDKIKEDLHTTYKILHT